MSCNDLRKGLRHLDAESLDAQRTITGSNGFEEYGRLVATGEVPFDLTLPEHDLQLLAEIVRRERRTQLIRFLARLIAQSLHRPPDNS